MDDRGNDIGGLSALEKRALLEKLLKEKTTDTASGSSDPFQFPPDYAAFKAQLETTGDTGVGDLFFQSFDGINSHLAAHNGQNLINYCSYNYLGMSGDPVVSQAASRAIETYGTSVSASRLVSGERPLHRQLESELAEFIGVEDAIVFVGGYTTNADTIGHLMGPDDLIIYDSLIHASIQSGAKLSGAKVIPFPHNNIDALENILKRQRGQARHILIVVEGVYSMDGDIPDLGKVVELKKRHGALLMVDEAHSVGVLGATGRGISEHCRVAATEIDLWMGTLSKSLASCGGYIAGSRELVTYLRYTAPGFVYSVGITPANAGAALASLRLLQAEPERVSRLQTRSRLFHDLASERGLDTGESRHAAAVPIIIGQSVAAIRVSRSLMQKGILALPIGFPAVPENSARLRCFISCTHTEDEIRQTVEAIASAIEETR